MSDAVTPDRTRPAAERRIERWRRLADAGLVHGDMPASPPATPWMIGALVGTSAWLAALFLLFFLGIALEDFVRTSSGAIVTGLAVVAVASVALRFAGERTFAVHLAFAFSLAGQALVFAGIVMDSGRDEAWRWWLFALFESALVAIVPHGGHRVLATLAAATAMLVALWVMSFSALFLPLVLAAYVAAQSRTLAAAPEPALWHALAIGLALALVVAFVHASVPELWRPEAANGVGLRWAGVALLALVASWAGALVAHDSGASTRTVALSAAALAALAIVAFRLPAVAASIVMLVVAFAAGQRVLCGLAVVTLLGTLAHYYYRLDTPLAEKALAWLAIGIVLVGARIVVLRLVPPGEPE